MIVCMPTWTEGAQFLDSRKVLTWPVIGPGWLKVQALFTTWPNTTEWRNKLTTQLHAQARAHNGILTIDQNRLELK